MGQSNEMFFRMMDKVKKILNKKEPTVKETIEMQNNLATLCDNIQYADNTHKETQRQRAGFMLRLPTEFKNTQHPTTVENNKYAKIECPNCGANEILNNKCTHCDTVFERV